MHKHCGFCGIEVSSRDDLGPSIYGYGMICDSCHDEEQGYLFEVSEEKTHDPYYDSSY